MSQAGPTRKQTMWNRRQVAVDLMGLSLVCLFLGLVVEPGWIYHSFGTIIPDAPVYSTGWSFARESLALPGGCICYVSGLLSQGFASSWLGALIIGVTAWCLYTLLRWHLTYAGIKDARLLASVPVLLILMVYNRYQHPLTACLTVSMGLLFSLVFERVPWRGPLVRTGLYCLMAVAGYWLMGTGGLVTFALLTAIYLLLVRRQWIIGLVVLLVTAYMIWFLADQVFHLSPKQAFLISTPFVPDTMKAMKVIPWVWIVALYAFSPLAVLLVVSWKRIRPGRSAKAKHRPIGILKKFALPGLAALLWAFGLYWSLDAMNRQFVRMNALSRQGRWTGVLEAARHLPKGASNVFCAHDINRALFNTGRLPYEMFSFPQNPDALMLTHETSASALTRMKLCDLYVEMGRLNAAEKMASEILTDKGPLGFLLERLAWIHLIKGQTDTARVYLNAMRRDLVCDRKAELILNGLDQGFSPNQRAALEKVRSCVPRTGTFRPGEESVESILVPLLEHNPSNRMAFEYLMACYLLTGQIDKVAVNVDRLDRFGYSGIPTHYEEALLLYYGSLGQRLDLKRFPIRQETVQRYLRFVELNNSMQAADPRSVIDRLVQEFGGSYLFYYRFNRISPR